MINWFVIKNDVLSTKQILVAAAAAAQNRQYIKDRQRTRCISVESAATSKKQHGTEKGETKTTRFGCGRCLLLCEREGEEGGHERRKTKKTKREDGK
jgi:hypothetical protein